MLAKLNHMAVISHQYPFLERFYRSLFKFDTTKRSDHDAEASAVVGDGYVGLNILPRRDGYVGGFDHFGIVVDDVNEVLSRMQKAHPTTSIVKRPSTRPFAAYSGHDPDGNVFDLAEQTSENLRDVYAQQQEEGWGGESKCQFHRFAIRTRNAEVCAQFYQDVFELKPANVTADKAGHHLTDGRVTLSLMQWDIEDFDGMSIKRSGPEHIGIKVPDLEEFKSEMKRIGEKNTYLAARPLGGSEEAETRRALFAQSALGKMQIADPDGNWIDITDE